jgi:hypothetical protein
MNNKKEMNNERTKAQVAYLFAVERAPFRRTRPYCLLDWQGAHSKLLTRLLWGAPLSEGGALIAYLIGRGLIQKLTKPESGTQLCMRNE